MSCLCCVQRADEPEQDTFRTSQDDYSANEWGASSSSKFSDRKPRNSKPQQTKETSASQYSYPDETFQDQEDDYYMPNDWGAPASTFSDTRGGAKQNSEKLQEYNDAAEAGSWGEAVGSDANANAVVRAAEQERGSGVVDDTKGSDGEAAVGADSEVEWGTAVTPLNSGADAAAAPQVRTNSICPECSHNSRTYAQKNCSCV